MLLINPPNCLFTVALLWFAILGCPGCLCTQEQAKAPKEESAANADESANKELAPQDPLAAAKPAASAQPQEAASSSPTSPTKAATSLAPVAESSATPATAAGSGSGPKSAAKTAAAAHRQAQQQLAAADKLASQGEHGKAFEQALEAWKGVSRYSATDPACHELAQSLADRLERFGEAANQNASRNESKPIEVR